MGSCESYLSLPTLHVPCKRALRPPTEVTVTGEVLFGELGRQALFCSISEVLNSYDAFDQLTLCERRPFSLRYSTMSQTRTSPRIHVCTQSPESQAMLFIHDLSQLECIFLTLWFPSYSSLSTAAATVSVPPTTAQKPTRKPEKDFARCSRLMTFIGEMSCTVVSEHKCSSRMRLGRDVRMRRRRQECRPARADAPYAPDPERPHLVANACAT